MAAHSTKSRKNAAKKQPKSKGGRPSFEPTDEQRASVKAMAGFGIPQPDIARVIGVAERTLRKHFRHELDTGMTVAIAKVAESLFKKAIGKGPQSVGAAIFFLKARAGWKETSKHEHTGEDGRPIEYASPLDELARRIDGIAARRGTPETPEDTVH